MHSIQHQILALSDKINLSNLTLREIGEKVGDPHPQKIKHHLDQLFKKGFLKRTGSAISRIGNDSSDNFYIIPVVGAANCGQAVTFADENIESYLTVSHKMIRCEFHPKKTFAVRAIGNSMNRASVQGTSINDGDFVIVNTNQQDLAYYSNKYVLSVINGMANIKKFVFDKENNRILLLSESSEMIPPIYIHQEDFGYYMINGIIADVVKSPNVKVPQKDW